MSKTAKTIAWIFAGLLTLAGIIIIAIANFFDVKKIVSPKTVAASATVPDANPVANPVSVPGTTTVSSYVTLSGIPIKYKRLLSTGETAFTIPAGTIEYYWKIISGEAVIDGVTLPAGMEDRQEYVTGLTYGAIAITGVTGEVQISYKKPA